MVESNIPRVEANLREVENVHGNFIALLIQCLFNFESPKKSRNRDECPLFCEPLAAADAPPPSKGHIPLFGREGTVIGTIFQISVRIEAVWFGEFSFVVVNSPNVTLDPGSLWDEPALNRRV